MVATVLVSTFKIFVPNFVKPFVFNVNDLKRWFQCWSAHSSEIMMNGDVPDQQMVIEWLPTTRHLIQTFNKNNPNHFGQNSPELHSTIQTFNLLQ